MPSELYKEIQSICFISFHITKLKNENRIIWNMSNCGCGKLSAETTRFYKEVHHNPSFDNSHIILSSCEGDIKIHTHSFSSKVFVKIRSFRFYFSCSFLIKYIVVHYKQLKELERERCQSIIQWLVLSFFVSTYYSHAYRC